MGADVIRMNHSVCMWGKKTIKTASKVGCNFYGKREMRRLNWFFKLRKHWIWTIKFQYQFDTKKSLTLRYKYFSCFYFSCYWRMHFIVQLCMKIFKEWIYVFSDLPSCWERERGFFAFVVCDVFVVVKSWLIHSKECCLFT